LQLYQRYSCITSRLVLDDEIRWGIAAAYP
jgi:hypothetical protein